MGVADGSSLATISGFPAGRKKTVLSISPMSFIWDPASASLADDLEIYWDAIEWARGLPQSQLKTAFCVQPLADLHYRGYSSINRAPRAGWKYRITPILSEQAALARSDWLLYSVRRRARAFSASRRPVRNHELRGRDDTEVSRVASATDRLAARLRHRRRRMDQGWGLQFDFFQNRAAIASSQRARLRDPSGKARGRVDVSATPGGLGEIPHPIRHSGGIQQCSEPVG